MNRKIIKNALIMATMVLFVPMAAAQVTIGSVTEPRATLHVVAPTTPTGVPIGVIAPQITLANLQGLTGAYIHGANQHGAIIFVSAIAPAVPAGRTVLVTEAGYYWFDASAADEADWRWRPFGGGAVAAPRFIQRSFSGAPNNQVPDTYFDGTNHLVLIHVGAFSGNIVVDDLTPGQAGTLLTIVNRGGNSPQVSLTIINTTTGLPEANQPFSNVIMANRARTAMWTGTAWVELTM